MSWFCLFVVFSVSVWLLFCLYVVVLCLYEVVLCLFEVILYLFEVIFGLFVAILHHYMVILHICGCFVSFLLVLSFQFPVTSYRASGPGAPNLYLMGQFSNPSMKPTTCHLLMLVGGASGMVTLVFHIRPHRWTCWNEASETPGGVTFTASLIACHRHCSDKASSRAAPLFSSLSHSCRK